MTDFCGYCYISASPSARIYFTKAFTAFLRSSTGTKPLALLHFQNIRFALSVSRPYAFKNLLDLFLKFKS